MPAFPSLPHFGRGNAKLPDSTLTFALPSGHTCPGARDCLARADRTTGKITDGPGQTFRCYEASIESLRPQVRAARWRNLSLLEETPARELRDLLWLGLTAHADHKTTHVRWFTGGDCYSQALRDAIVDCAMRTPWIHYFYTKNLPLFLQHGSLLALPANLRVTASWGGRHDSLIEQGLFPRNARVLHTRAEAEALGLPIDTSDLLAWQEQPSAFCHLTHGCQPAGSAAANAIAQRRRTGDFTGYGARRPARAA